MYNFTRSASKERAQPVAQAPFLTLLHLPIKIREARKQGISQWQFRTAAGARSVSATHVPGQQVESGAGWDTAGVLTNVGAPRGGGCGRQSGQHRVGEGTEKLRESRDRDRHTGDRRLQSRVSN